MDKNAALFYKSACDLKIPTRIIEGIAGFAIYLGNRRLYFRGGDTPFNCGSSVGISLNKYCTSTLLKEAGFPVPKFKAFHRDEFEKNKLESLIQDLQFPLVVKPTVGTADGVDVLCNLSNIAQVKKYMSECFKKYSFVTVEEFHGGLNTYRVLVFCNKVIGVVQRFPARVVGDGVHTLNELIDLYNLEREKNLDTATLKPIKMDEEIQIRLKELNMTLNTIPKENEMVFLSYTCNDASLDGTIKSLGNQICKENALLCIRAAMILDLSLVGFDVVCEDIGVPIETSGGVIIEANYNPDITIHESPLEEDRKRVSRMILKRLIWRYPLSYARAICQRKGASAYVKGFILLLMLLLYRLTL